MKTEYVFALMAMFSVICILIIDIVGAMCSRSIIGNVETIAVSFFVLIVYVIVFIKTLRVILIDVS